MPRMSVLTGIAIAHASVSSSACRHQPNATLTTPKNAQLAACSAKLRKRQMLLRAQRLKRTSAPRMHRPLRPAPRPGAATTHSTRNEAVPRRVNGAEEQVQVPPEIAVAVAVEAARPQVQRVLAQSSKRRRTQPSDLQPLSLRPCPCSSGSSSHSAATWKASSAHCATSLLAHRQSCRTSQSCIRSSRSIASTRA